MIMINKTLGFTGGEIVPVTDAALEQRPKKLKLARKEDIFFQNSLEISNFRENLPDSLVGQCFWANCGDSRLNLCLVTVTHIDPRLIFPSLVFIFLGHSGR